MQIEEIKQLATNCFVLVYPDGEKRKINTKKRYILKELDDMLEEEKAELIDEKIRDDAKEMERRCDV